VSLLVSRHGAIFFTPILRKIALLLQSNRRRAVQIRVRHRILRGRLMPDSQEVGSIPISKVAALSVKLSFRAIAALTVRSESQLKRFSRHSAHHGGHDNWTDGQHGFHCNGSLLKGAEQLVLAASTERGPGSSECVSQRGVLGAYVHVARPANGKVAVRAPWYAQKDVDDPVRRHKQDQYERSSSGVRPHPLSILVNLRVVGLSTKRNNIA
jgi:hypothetical protein